MTNQIVGSTRKPSLFPGRKVLARYISPLWWRHVFAFSWQFRRQLFVPAIFFVASALILTPTMQLFASLQGVGNDVQDAGPLIGKLLIALVAQAAAGILFLIGMSLGVFRLTAFTRAFLLYPPPLTTTDLTSGTYKSQLSAAQQHAAEALKKQKGYLAKTWLLATLIMSPLIFLFCASSFWALALTMPDTSSIRIPPEMRSMAIYAQIALGVSMVILSNYSVVTLAITSMTNCTIGQAIRKSLLLGLTTAPMMTLVSAFVLFITTLVTTPYVVVTMIQPTAQWITPGSLPVALAWEIWQVLSGILIYPICTALLTEVVRDCVDHQSVDSEPAETATLTPGPDAALNQTADPTLIPAPKDGNAN